MFPDIGRLPALLAPIDLKICFHNEGLSGKRCRLLLASGRDLVACCVRGVFLWLQRGRVVAAD